MSEGPVKGCCSARPVLVFDARLHKAQRAQAFNSCIPPPDLHHN